MSTWEVLQEAAISMFDVQRSTFQCLETPPPKRSNAWKKQAPFFQWLETESSFEKRFSRQDAMNAKKIDLG